MDKIYHIYAKENQVQYAVLSEEDFKVVWRNLDHTQYEYEELTVDRTVMMDSSYWHRIHTLLELNWKNF